MNWFACTSKASIVEHSDVWNLANKKFSGDNVVAKNWVDKVVPVGMLNQLAVLEPKYLRSARHEAHTHGSHINNSHKTIKLFL